MFAPQSYAEIRPLIDALQAIDRLLDVIWNPKAVMVAKGSYSETGTLVPPTYDGRWDVIRYDSPEQGHAGFHPERGYTLITHVTEYVRHGGILCMIVDGDYAPLDDRLLEFMRSADSWNVDQHRQVRHRLWAQHDAREAADSKLDQAMAAEGLDRVHFKANFAGGVGNWQGKGADFGGMEVAAAARTKQAVNRILGSSVRSVPSHE